MRPVLLLFLVTGCAPAVRAIGDAPQWMRAAASSALTDHDDKIDAVLLYSERNVSVISVDKVRVQVRKVYKIIRPAGRDYGTAAVVMNPQTKLTALRGWCIPAQGKDYEVKDKEAVEVSPPKVDGGELITDVKVRLLRIPAADPGNVVGYEYEVEERPLVLQDSWEFQQGIPGNESHYSLQLPTGWEYHSYWINFPEIKAAEAGSTQLRWNITNIKAIKTEDQMPPLMGVAGQMIVSFYPSGGATGKAFSNWQQMGTWYLTLADPQRAVSTEIKQKVTEQVASAPSAIDKIKLIAQFLQKDIRYVAIELGIGGYQPHPAAEVFIHRYGDCKDKATLMSAMLHEIGVESYYVVINTTRGSVTPEMPAHITGFNHVILAIRLPDATKDPSLVATMSHPQLGTIVFFDPTNDLVSFGQIGGYLQANYGLLVTPSGGDLVQLPTQPPAMNGVQRSAKLIMDATGTLRGGVHEIHVGDSATSQRGAFLSAPTESDRIRPMEKLLAESVPNSHITKAHVVNVTHTEQPFAYDFSFEANNYGKAACKLMLVRPRVMGVKSSALLETKEPRRFSIEFSASRRDTDIFEITLPRGYQVEDLPAPIDVDRSFASYHSKLEVVGDSIRYSRSFELKQLDQAADLKELYRVIADDERSMVVLRAASQ